MSSPMGLSPTTFVSGAKDVLAAADVYKVTATTPINSIQEIIDDVSLENATGFRSSMSSMLNTSLSDAAMMKANAEGLAAKARTELSSRLAGVNDQITAAMRAASLPTVDGIMKSVRDSSIVNSIKASVGGIEGVIPKDMMSDALSVGDMINNIGCELGAFISNDMGALSGMYSGILNACSRIGIPNIFGTMMSCRTDKNLINQVANNALPGVINSSDYGSLYSMSQLTSPGSLKMCNPDIIDNFSSSYVSPGGSSANNETLKFSNVMNSFNTINPSWNNTTRNTGNGPQSIYNISAINNGSNDFQRMVRSGTMSNQPGSNKLMLLSSVLPKTNVLSEITKHFSSTPLLSGSNNLAARDPITIIKNNLINSILPKTNYNNQNYGNTGYGNNSYNNYSNNNVIKPVSSTYIAFDGTKTVTTRTTDRYSGYVSTREIVYSPYGTIISDRQLS